LSNSLTRFGPELRKVDKVFLCGVASEYPKGPLPSSDSVPAFPRPPRDKNTVWFGWRPGDGLFRGSMYGKGEHVHHGLHCGTVCLLNFNKLRKKGPSRPVSPPRWDSALPIVRRDRSRSGHYLRGQPAVSMSNEVRKPDCR
jgi:hypothetical protein